MTGRPRTVLAVAAMALLAPVLANTTPPATAAVAAKHHQVAYNYKACANYGGFFIDGIICLKTVIRRQDDGKGTVVTRVHPFAYTRDDRGRFLDWCGNAFDDTAAETYWDEVGGFPNVRSYWKVESPDLSERNRCSVIYHPDVRVGRKITEVTFSYRVHRPGTDQNGELSIRVWRHGWGCAGAAEYCGRDVAKAAQR